MAAETEQAGKDSERDHPRAETLRSQRQTTTPRSNRGRRNRSLAAHVLAVTDKPASMGPANIAGSGQNRAPRAETFLRSRAWTDRRRRYRLLGQPRILAVASGDGSGLAALGDRVSGQNPAEIPKIYQPRLEPDRSMRAKRIGASAASELAVERALDWLGRHQDDDGRWDGGVARYEEGAGQR